MPRSRPLRRQIPRFFREDSAARGRWLRSTPGRADRRVRRFVGDIVARARRGECPETTTNRDQVDQHAYQPHRMSDRLVLLEVSQSAEEICPIVLAAADEWQLLRARVADVDRDVPEVLRDPPERGGGRVP